MRHGVAGRKLGRKTAHREAMLRNMASSLITHGRIRTTLQKAKELRVFAEKLVTLGKRDSLHARRLAYARLHDRAAVLKLFSVVAPAFGDRNGGYTRILRLPQFRHGDGSEMALIEYLREDLPQEGKPTKKKIKEHDHKGHDHDHDHGDDKAKPVAKGKGVVAKKLVKTAKSQDHKDDTDTNADKKSKVAVPKSAKTTRNPKTDAHKGKRSAKG